MSSNPQQVGEAVAALGAASGVFAWLKPWKFIASFFRLFGHEKRLAALENNMATKSSVEALTELHQKHVADDATAFRDIGDKLDHVLEVTPRKTDLDRVEHNLTEVMLEGLRRAGR